MSSNKSAKPKFHQIISLALASLTIIFLVFYGSLPVSYDYEVGSIATQDIYAPRTFADTYATEREAVRARDTVADIFVRSDKQAQVSIDRVDDFFDLAEQARTNMTQARGTTSPMSPAEAASQVTLNVEQTMNVKIKSEDILVFFEMSNPTFTYIREKTTTLAELIMLGDVNEHLLESKIDEQISSFCESSPSYEKFADAMRIVLSSILEPNTIYDEKATEDSANNAYMTALNDPIMIDKGTKLVESGAIIDEHVYSNLVELELIRDSSFNVVIFLRVTVYVLIISASAAVYLNIERKKLQVEMPVFYMLLITFLITVAASVYLSSLSTLLCIVIFFASVCATYIGTQNSIILSVVNLLLIWPMYGFDPEMFFINLIGIILCSIFAGRSDRIINNAALIFFPTIATIATSIAFNFLHGNTRTEYLNSLIYTFVSCIASLVAAVGLSPIYELVSNAASPVKLITLSQPGQHLMKRLFLEASGTYHHSMMVATLADSAAEAIGADTLLCKVAAYYHDIGKLEHPEFFTENQHGGENPHDKLTVMESVGIITKHPEDGVKLAKRERLPNAIIKIIDEHHGTTYPSYFYRKAVEDAKARGLEPPDVNNFRYRGHIPSSRESAIVMIADTCEAAVRSMKTTDVQSAEQLIRVLIKDKIDQDQLINSGLNFDDIEKIVIAFRQVYAGVFHERIKYPE
ncbi:HD family phosphohydrolase [Butyrivibrio sp. AE2032]|uniref:HD family phosphohydrolase n=1 Tax=Butyrivibrio sp. AE2032 TaxID=1458463 RepID=UPI000550F2C6|nr:HDIG domain-containing metalloprotein [Butyrivibrio sp. AE2032]